MLPGVRIQLILLFREVSHGQPGGCIGHKANPETKREKRREGGSEGKLRRQDGGTGYLVLSIGRVRSKMKESNENSESRKIQISESGHDGEKGRWWFSAKE